jgi:hypothetical protein
MGDHPKRTITDNLDRMDCGRSMYTMMDAILPTDAILHADRITFYLNYPASRSLFFKKMDNVGIKAFSSQEYRYFWIFSPLGQIEA